MAVNLHLLPTTWQVTFRRVTGKGLQIYFVALTNYVPTCFIRQSWTLQLQVTCPVIKDSYDALLLLP